MKTKLVVIIIILFSNIYYSQSLAERYGKYGELFITKLSSAPFPHIKRMNGHTYKNQNYSFEEHYKDSSVAVFIPKNFEKSRKINFVVYFHGWNNNIDSALSQFNLIEQFYSSKKNAVFVFPEGPKNSPDSFGGKLEERNGLKTLLQDIVNLLVKQNKIKKTEIGQIILAGHSGAYRVISYCLAYGGLTRNISEIILFDALYGKTDKYLHWITHFKGKFINIYTDNGGTKSETEYLMQILKSRKIPYLHKEEKNLNTADLKANRLVFIHTELSHNEVISTRKQLENYLRTSSLPDK